MLKVLHTADWHLDLSNLEFAVPAIEAGIKAEPYDLFVHAGDLAVNRSMIHPHVAYEIRSAIDRGIADASCGGIVVAGNHDQSFIAERKGMVEGIMGDGHNDLLLASTPVVEIRCGVGFVCIPTPNKYWAKSQGPDADIGALLHTMIQAKIAEARGYDGVKWVAVIYHGTIGGAMLSDEVLMPSGVDISVPHTAFNGADIVLAGHIHHRQELPGSVDGTRPPVFYSGAPAPLTWNDRHLEPGMYLHTFGETEITSELVPLPVLSQMIHHDLDVPVDYEGNLTADILRIIDGSDSGSRVRVRVSGLGTILDSIDYKAIRGHEEASPVRSVKIVTDRSDTVVARMDLKDGFSMAEAMGEWAKIKQVPDALIKPLLTMAGEIEARVQDYHLDACYDMKPVGLSVKNWCQYEDAEVDFSDLGSLVLIDGPNYSGKSNLSRAILFALYKKQVAGSRIADLIRKGEDTMSVTLRFESGGNHYRIIRDVKRMGEGASTALHFQQLADSPGGAAVNRILHDSNWSPVVEGTAKETQAKIESMVGPLDLFLATSFAGQNAVDALLDLTPAELKDTLMSVLQRNFDARLKEGRSIRDSAEKRRDEAKSKIEALESSTIEVSHEAVEAAALRRDDLEGQITVSEMSVSGLDAKLAEAKAAKATADALTAEISDLERKQYEGEKAVDKAKDRVDELERASMDASTLRNQMEPEPDIIALRSAGESARKKLDDARQSGVDAIREIQAAKEELTGKYHAANQDVIIGEGMVKTMDADIERASVAAKLIAKVPCSGASMVFVDCPEDPVDTGTCQFLKDAIKSRDDLPAMLAGLDDQKRMVATKAESRDRYKAELDEAQAREESERARQKADGEGMEMDASNAVARIESASLTIQANAERQRKIDVLEERASGINAARNLLIKAGEDIGRVVAGLSMARQRSSQAREAIGGYEATERASITERTRLAALRSDMEAIVSEQGRLRGQMESWAAAQKQIQMHRDVESASGREIEVAATYVEAMHRDGLPFLLLEQYAIPALRESAARYLKASGLTLEIESERELTTGELRNHVEMSFSDHRGRHPIGAASGFQRTAIGVALRNALADLLAQATGSRIWLAVQDEGFGTMDAENLEAAKGTVRSIAERRGWFIVISHVPGMTEIADTVLRVTDRGGVSSVEVM